MCLICSKTFTYNCNLIRHRKIHTGCTKLYKCTKCDGVFGRKYHLQRHRKRCLRTPRKEKQGPVTSQRTPLDLREESKVKLASPSYHIEAAAGRCLRSSTRGDKLFQKPKSTTKSTGLFKRKRHLSSSQRKRARLSKSSQSHNNSQQSCFGLHRYKLRRHVKPLIYNQSYRSLRRTCKKRQITCAQCLKTYKSRADLVRHLRKHSGAKPFECPECLRCFTLKASLTRHFRIHTGEKPYTCLICSKAFSDKSACKKHIWIHTKKKPMVCKVCGKTFLQKSQLTTHLTLHK